MRLPGTVAGRLLVGEKDRYNYCRRNPMPRVCAWGVPLVHFLSWSPGLQLELTDHSTFDISLRVAHGLSVTQDSHLPDFVSSTWLASKSPRVRGWPRFPPRVAEPDRSPTISDSQSASFRAKLGQYQYMSLCFEGFVRTHCSL